MSEFVELLGENLKMMSGTNVVDIETQTALQGKIVGLYFSADWCVNCHAFTPILRKARQYAVSHGAPFEIVYCHLDNSYDEWIKYYRNMPGWYALPYERCDIVTTLKQMFNFSSIPHLVMISADGIINPDAKEYVEDDPEAFPWAQMSIKEEVGPHLRNAEGPVDASVLDGKTVCYFFGMYNSTASQEFSTQFMGYFNTLKERGIPFETVYISFDETEEQYNSYFSTMKGWYSAGYDLRLAHRLSRNLGELPLPCPVIVNADNEVINYDARDLIRDTGLESYPWNSVICRDIELDGAGMLGPGLVVFMDDEGQFPPEVRDPLVVMLQKMANQALTRGDNTVLFNYTIERGDTTATLRQQMTGFEKPVPLLTIYEQGEAENTFYFYVPSSYEISESNINQFIDDYKNHRLQRHTMSSSSVC